MKRTLLFLLVSCLFAINGFAQSDIKMRTEYGSKNTDLMSILQFENIGLNKLIFSGEDLKGKDFQISVKEFVGGKLRKTEVAFDSREDEYFKIKNNEFSFRVLAKATAQNTVRFDFQFNGFYKQKEFGIAANQQGFALKDFLGGKPEIAVPLKTNAYILTYMMPYKKADGSSTYCEVAQSDVDPENFGIKYAIPTYFLIDIKFQ
jgi:hypothetical protein